MKTKINNSLLLAFLIAMSAIFIMPAHAGSDYGAVKQNSAPMEATVADMQLYAMRNAAMHDITNQQPVNIGDDIMAGFKSTALTLDVNGELTNPDMDAANQLHQKGALTAPFLTAAITAAVEKGLVRFGENHAYLKHSGHFRAS